MLIAQMPIKLINGCSALYEDNNLINAIIWYSEKPVQSIKKVYMYGRYPAVSIERKKIHIHRLIGLYKYKDCDIAGCCFHHLDHDKLNASWNNIMMMDCKTHASIHNAGRLPPQKAVDTLININHSRKGKRGKSKRPDVKPREVYELRVKGWSFNKISLRYKLDWSCVKNRFNDFIHDNPELLER